MKQESNSDLIGSRANEAPSSYRTLALMLGALVVLVCILPKPALAIVVDTTGGRKATMTPATGIPVPASAPGLICIGVRAGATSNTATATTCGVQGNFPGIAKGKPKFMLNGAADSDSFVQTATATVAPVAIPGIGLLGGGSTLAIGEGKWTAFSMVGPGGAILGLGATQRASANVTRAFGSGLPPFGFPPAPPFPPSGRAAVEVKDPIEMVFSTSSTLAYQFSLGDALTTSEPSLRFSSDDPDGFNSFEVSAAFQNASSTSGLGAVSV